MKILPALARNPDANGFWRNRRAKTRAGKPRPCPTIKRQSKPRKTKAKAKAKPMETTSQSPESELTLDATLATSQDETDLTLEASIVPIEKWTRKNRNQYLGKLRLLGTIHAELADKLDERREAIYGAFFMPEDKYIPASREKDLLVRLALGMVHAEPSEPNEAEA